MLTFKILLYYFFEIILIMLGCNNMTDYLEYVIYSLIVLHSHQQQLFIYLYNESIKKRCCA